MTQQPFPVKGPFQGIVSDLVSTQASPTAFDDVLNFFVRKGRLVTRPFLQTFTLLPSAQLVRTIDSFKDANGKFHTFYLQNYAAQQTPAQMLSIVGGAPFLNPLGIPGLATGQQGSTLPFSVAPMVNQVFFSNLGYPVMYLDGSNAVQFTADGPGSCKFLAVNVQHLIQAYCQEPAAGQSGSTLFPRRVRWSASGNPQEWNPLTDFTAGFVDMIDVPDDITGLATIGTYTFIWRTNGLTVMFPTGIGLSPFQFENFSNAEEGIGNIFPYALATFDNRTIFISDYDIHMFDGTSFTSIGGINRRKIFADLAAASGDAVTGKIVPHMGLGYDFMSYWLTIPGPNVTWIYTYDDQQWIRFNSSKGYLTAARGSVYTS